MERNFWITKLLKSKNRIIAADRKLEKRVLTKSKKLQNERLDYMQDIFTKRVAAILEGSILSKVENLLTYPVVSKTNNHARIAQNLELLAMMKEYSLNYESSIVPKGNIYAFWAS